MSELRVSGFDPDGEPVISVDDDDGTVSIQFEAMPPFFAEDNGTEAEFEDFDKTMSDALGIVVRRDDRELFVIDTCDGETAKRVKIWLETFRADSTRSE